MRQALQIRCKNNGQTLTIPVGSSLAEIYEQSGLQLQYGPINAKVNNKVEGMHYRVYNNKDVEYQDLYTSSGSRSYTRTLFFVLCKAVNDIYPNSTCVIDIPVSKGYYVNLDIDHPVGLEDVDKLRKRMQEIIDANLPVRRHVVPTQDAINLFREKGDIPKVRLLESVGALYTTYYQIEDYVDFYYGSLLTHTGKLYLFGLEKYYDGLLLRIPSLKNPGVLGEMTRQDKMFDIFLEHHRWQKILGIRTVGDFNAAINEGQGSMVVNVSEALQEKKIARIADEIANRKGVKLVLLAGPSSSGKTTTCKRLSIQLLTNGIKPLQISLDDYFVDREKTPLGENGEYDYESLYALNLPLLNEQFNALFRGEEVELPRFNFNTGKQEFRGEKLRIDDRTILILEGIHALNPEMTSAVDDSHIFRVYASALTSLSIDENNNISTSDNRLLRRMVRDNRVRGITPEDTILRWHSVRRGENRNIFPFQENADAEFNSALIFELPMLKYYAEPLLRRIPSSSPAFSEATRLLKFLDYIVALSPDEIAAIPPTSIMREFIGGQTL